MRGTNLRPTQAANWNTYTGVARHWSNKTTFARGHKSYEKVNEPNYY